MHVWRADRDPLASRDLIETISHVTTRILHCYLLYEFLYSHDTLFTHFHINIIFLCNISIEFSLLPFLLMNLFKQLFT
jgi:hypothetical protein